MPVGLSEDDRSLVAFAERCLALLDQGSFSATYKYAVLLGLMDLCLEKAGPGGELPRRIPISDLAQKVVELYRPQTVGLKDPALLLRQNNRGQAEIVSAIRRFRELGVADPLAPLLRARLAAPKEYEKLLIEVEWKLIEMPLPKLQRVGQTRDDFIYKIGWDDRVKRSELHASGFDRALQFRPGVPERLVQLSGLLRPLLKREWASMVARFNPDQVSQATLEDFLFGRDRISTDPVRKDLCDLQNGKCFYCSGPVGKNPVVDHFLPWARYPNDAIENLVVADAPCNGNKRDFLAAAEHVDRWRMRISGSASLVSQLAEIAKARQWEQAIDRTQRVVSSIYTRLPVGAKLWRGRNEFVLLEGSAIRKALQG
jgi:hypothetical protein